MKKIISFLLKCSGTVMAFAVCIATLTQNSTCGSLFYQPKVPKSLLDTDIQ